MLVHICGSDMTKLLIFDKTNYIFDQLFLEKSSIFDGHFYFWPKLRILF